MKTRERINESYRKSNPKNCPVIEQTGDGVEVGTCTFYLPDGKTCPRHGDVTKYEENARNYGQKVNMVKPMEFDFYPHCFASFSFRKPVENKCPWCKESMAEKARKE